MARYNYKHGLINHSLYSRWCNIKTRCYNPNHNSYKDYGGRGIQVCNEWIEDFKTFYDYVTALPNAMEPGFTLDRIDNDGNYEPGNLRWADRETQNANARMRTNNKTGYTGISYHGDKYRAKVGNKHLGIFLTAEAAAAVRNQFIIRNNLTNKMS